METIIERQTLSRVEAARYLGIHINSLDRNTKIPRVRIGGRVLFRKETLDKLLIDSERSDTQVKRRKN